ncbi:serine/threonine-protein kinase [Actinoplanes sp. RD1]|uniref:serine/threonine-protein kinase n=1 Tax=Actinoplanes sp. RD1 TaxID=3064538 RepID=UPI002741AAD6|nr:serine/threonine-protein kinase [Actinoplanes sp. RD1]
MITNSAGGVGRVEPLTRDDPRWLGPYRMLGRLGRGGMGVVFLAEAPDRRQVAVKLVRTGLADDREFVARFRSEVDRARQVPAFCTAEVLDADVDHDPPYLVTEYVDGPSLAEAVETGGPLSPARLQAVAAGVATALVGIHGAGVIHRDLKPQNVLLAPGSPKVIDFGIARAFEATSRHTRTDQFVGTVAYMAPERFDNESDADLTAAADVFAWGCVIAYAGTGRTPFQGDTPTATAARILTQPPRLDGLAEPMRSFVALSLAKDPRQRPTARQILDELVGSGRPGASADQRRAMPVVPGRKPTRTRRRPLLAGVLAIALLLAGLGWWALAGGSAGTPVPGRAASRSAGPSAAAATPTGLAAWTTAHVKGCSLTDGVLDVASRKAGVLGCGSGPDTSLPGDLLLHARAQSAAGGACLAFWFHMNAQGDGTMISLCGEFATVHIVKGTTVRALLTATVKAQPRPEEINEYEIAVTESAAQVRINGTLAARLLLPPVAGRDRVQIGLKTPDGENPPLTWLRIYDAEVRAA